MIFSEQQITKWKGMLESEKKKLEDEIRNLDTRADFGSDVDGFDEEADEAEELVNEKGAIFVLKEKLRAVLRGLEKISSKEMYGTCEKCKKEIETEILDIAPESQFCKSCKQSD